MAKTAMITGQGPNFTVLANAVSDAIYAAQLRGMELDECLSVLVQVAADYGRGTYGKDFLTGLAELIVARGNEPMPEDPNG
ncbi:hypothetical protein LAC81_07495 [Ensifer adhaerens]|uniref:hypothetical protein n=1 Tax=Ensifer adhaerens TaxID=106592 RepID=UPI001CBAC086|nr:hypothetical protein [Ensifer adhaerens]MBZ7921622.1 hypothetical protein [Ensifer adhaerens]UAX94041.1 hypothetical protein LAC78_07490 [Ensifer adhaerens]UAY01675.1 hypothetical protein LAC80_07495 [Ensifer adhaerens]UAY09059.1 hypothetical protein LAC81_07495 [Ensifer adhaerens]